MTFYKTQSTVYLALLRFEVVKKYSWVDPDIPVWKLKTFSSPFTYLYNIKFPGKLKWTSRSSVDFQFQVLPHHDLIRVYT